MPMRGGDSDTDIYIEGRPLPRTDDEATITWYRLVSQDYFDLMGITLQKGRVFSASEAAPVVVVNQTAAARLWPGEDRIGRRARFGTRGDAPWFTIVGIVREVRGAGRVRPRGSKLRSVFVHAGTRHQCRPQDVGRPDGPLELAGAGRAQRHADTPVSRVNRSTRPRCEFGGGTTLRGHARRHFCRPGTHARGHGHLRRDVVRCRATEAEIGVRMALGADRRDVFRVVVGGALEARRHRCRLRVRRSTAADPEPDDAALRYSSARSLHVCGNDRRVIAVAALAGAVPGLRGSRVDPVVALRTE